MKITRRQLRRLIQEAVYSPVAAMSAAQQRIAKKSEEDGKDYIDKVATNFFKSGDEADEAQGTDLLDAIGGFKSPGNTGDSSAAAKSEFIGDRSEIKDEIVNTVINVKYKPIIDKLQLNDLDTFFNSPQWKEVLDIYLEQYIDIVAGEESFGIGFDTSGDRFPGQEIDLYEIMRDVYVNLDDEEAEMFMDIFENPDEHFSTYASDYYNSVGSAYSYKPKEYKISPGFARYAFYDIINFFKGAKEAISREVHDSGIAELYAANILSNQMDDRFIVFNPDAYGNSRFNK